MAGNNLLVLTGATGFVGFRVLVLALKAGYDVRIVVRSVAKANKVINSPSIKALQPSKEKLSFVVVEEITVAGAFDEAVKGAAYVIHCASPIPILSSESPTPEQYDQFFVQTARQSTVGLLESSRKSGTVRRVVITSSIVANVPFPYFVGQGDDKIFDSESRIPLDKGPYNFEFQAYGASKAAALNASEAWVAENKPDFDLISILPGWIFGPDELSTTADDFHGGSTNSVLLGFLRGSESAIPFNGNAIHVDDAAQLHVAALNPKIPGNQSFLASSDGLDGFKWEDGISIIKKHFPEAIAQGHLKTTGKQPTAFVRADSKKTEETFGIKFAGFEQQVKTLVTQYLQVIKA
jgi:nucleoside-diphosphate-sugar epimerase